MVVRCLSWRNRGLCICLWPGRSHRSLQCCSLTEECSALLDLYGYTVNTHTHTRTYIITVWTHCLYCFHVSTFYLMWTNPLPRVSGITLHNTDVWTCPPQNPAPLVEICPHFFFQIRVETKLAVRRLNHSRPLLTLANCVGCLHGLPFWRPGSPSHVPPGSCSRWDLLWSEVFSTSPPLEERENERQHEPLTALMVR